MSTRSWRNSARQDNKDPLLSSLSANLILDAQVEIPMFQPSEAGAAEGAEATPGTGAGEGEDSPDCEEQQQANVREGQEGQVCDFSIARTSLKANCLNSSFFSLYFCSFPGGRIRHLPRSTRPPGTTRPRQRQFWPPPTQTAARNNRRPPRLLPLARPTTRGSLRGRRIPWRQHRANTQAGGRTSIWYKKHLLGLCEEFL